MVPAEIVSAAEDCAGDDVFFQRIREWLDSEGDVNDTYDEWDNEDLSLLGRTNHPTVFKSAPLTCQKLLSLLKTLIANHQVYLDGLCVRVLYKLL